MKIRVNGVEMEAISASPEKGEAVLALLDDEGNQCLQPNGEPDTVTRRGIVEMVEVLKKRFEK